jgi:hypothetical protein
MAQYKLANQNRAILDHMKTAGSVALLTVALLFACVSLTGQTDRWTILLGGESGSAITTNTSEADLKRIYGSENVVRADIDQGEGYYEPGTVLFDSDPLRRLEVVWQEEGRLHPQTIRIRGEKTVWNTIHNISLGTTLMELERLNRRPFRLAGFAWDGSGGITSWQQGLLEKELGDPQDFPNRKEAGVIGLRLNPRCGSFEKAAYDQVLGDTRFSSGHPAMQRLNPCVSWIGWEFPDVK